MRPAFRLGGVSRFAGRSSAALAFANFGNIGPPREFRYPRMHWPVLLSTCPGGQGLSTRHWPTLFSTCPGGQGAAESLGEGPNGLGPVLGIGTRGASGASGTVRGGFGSSQTHSGLFLPTHWHAAFTAPGAHTTVAKTAIVMSLEGGRVNMASSNPSCLRPVASCGFNRHSSDRRPIRPRSAASFRNR